MLEISSDLSKTDLKIYYFCQLSKKAKIWPNGQTILFSGKQFQKGQVATLLNNDCWSQLVKLHYFISLLQHSTKSGASKFYWPLRKCLCFFLAVVSIHTGIQAMPSSNFSQGKVRYVAGLIYKMATKVIGLNVVYLLMFNSDSTKHVCAWAHARERERDRKRESACNSERSLP